MNKPLVNLQIGKNELKGGFIESLKNAFKTRQDVRVHILKSAGHTREKVRKMAEEIVSRLGKKYTYKIVGFTIFVKKWRKVKNKGTCF
jgi:RNA-binding protein YhbY